jgi:hypothetical protein
MLSLARLVRRFRFGSAIVVVSGLPRSGTSMMMKMLGAGGLELVTDRVRGADESNPEGYFELEAVKDLDKAAMRDVRWLANARGRGVKVLSALLPYLPESCNYRVILMQRPLSEVIASQNTMLARAGEATDVIPVADLTAQYEMHLRKTQALLASRACFDTLIVRYGDVLADPRAQADRVNQFVGGRLDVEAMAGAVDERLYRNRAHTTQQSR